MPASTIVQRFRRAVPDTLRVFRARRVAPNPALGTSANRPKTIRCRLLSLRKRHGRRRRRGALEIAVARKNSAIQERDPAVFSGYTAACSKCLIHTRRLFPARSPKYAAASVGKVRGCAFPEANIPQLANGLREFCSPRSQYCVASARLAANVMRGDFWLRPGNGPWLIRIAPPARWRISKT